MWLMHWFSQGSHNQAIVRLALCMIMVLIFEWVNVPLSWIPFCADLVYSSNTLFVWVTWCNPNPMPACQDSTEHVRPPDSQLSIDWKFKGRNQHYKDSHPVWFVCVAKLHTYCGLERVLEPPGCKVCHLLNTYCSGLVTEMLQRLCGQYSSVESLIPSLKDCCHIYK